MHNTKVLAAISLAFLLFLIGVVAVLSTGAVVDLGRNIPQTNLIDDYLIGVLWSLLLGASIALWPSRNTDKPWLLAVWFGKSFVCLVLMLYYEATYWFLDSYSYFAVPALGTYAEYRTTEAPGTRLMYDLVWIHLQVLPYSFHALKLTCAYVGLVAVYVIYRAAVTFIGREDIRIFLTIALFPSILFWSSILGKDPFVLLGIGLFVFGAVGWHTKGYSKYLLALVAGIAILGGMRPWLVPIFLMPLVLVYLLGPSHTLKKVCFTAIAGTAVVWITTAFFDSFLVDGFAELFLLIDEQARVGAEFGGSGQVIDADLSNPIAALAFMPLGAFTALFRPLPGEVLNLLGTLAGLENVLILVLLIRALMRGRWEHLRKPLIAAGVALILVWAAVYGFISYQNLGTAVRFKLQVLPILLLLLLYFGREQRTEVISRHAPAPQS